MNIIAVIYHFISSNKTMVTITMKTYKKYFIPFNLSISCIISATKIVKNDGMAMLWTPNASPCVLH